MLELRNVNITLKKTHRQIIKNLNLIVSDGDKIAIIGEEGNGKSTLLKFIYNIDLINDYCDCSGQAINNGATLGYLEQSLSDEQLNKTITDYIFDSEDIYCNAGEMARIFGRLNLVNSLMYSDRLISTLSGGEKVKLQLAKILYNNPDILLLDEPTNDLDIETLKWLENFIINFNRPIIFISHDELLLERTANVIVHFEQLMRKTEFKYTINKTNYKSYVDRRITGIIRQEQLAYKERDEYDKKAAKWQKIYNRVDFEQDTISRSDPHGACLLKKKMKTVKAQEKCLDRMKENFTDIPDPEESITFFFDGKINIPSGKTVLNINLDKLMVENIELSTKIELKVIGPEHIVIIGDNGVGKSTLLKHIYTLLKDKKDTCARYMPQDYMDILDDNITPIDFLSDASKDNITKARMFLGNMKFTSEEMLNKIVELSGGQKAKLLLLKLIIDEANVLILDEPTRNVSPLSNPIIRKVLNDFNGAIISVSHDRKYITEVANKVYILKKEGLFLLHHIDL